MKFGHEGGFFFCLACGCSDFFFQLIFNIHTSMLECGNRV